jgi:hypothetical protein
MFTLYSVLVNAANAAGLITHSLAGSPYTNAGIPVIFSPIAS